MTQERLQQLQLVLAHAHSDYEKMLNSHAFFKTQNHAMGQDMVQDTFVKTWKYLVRTGEISAMKAFLYHVLNNLIIDQYRKHKTVSLELLAQKGFEPGTKNFAEHLFAILDGKEAARLISLLPGAYHRVMEMKYIQELSAQEISNITGQSPASVAVQSHRGLKKLRLLYYPLTAHDRLISAH